jgi:hypothetical protein
MEGERTQLRDELADCQPYEVIDEWQAAVEASSIGAHDSTTSASEWQGADASQLRRMKSELALALALFRVTVGAISVIDAALSLDRAIDIRPHRNWALGAIMCEAIGGLLTLVGIGGPIGPGIVAEVLVVVAIVSSAPIGLWDASGRLGYFPALRAMSQLPHRWISIPVAVAASILAVVGNLEWSVDHALALRIPGSVQVAWFAFQILSVLAVIIVRVLQSRG